MDEKFKGDESTQSRAAVKVEAGDDDLPQP
jgi:hypothetical protein